MRWLVRHAALILNRFSVNPDGQTPYQHLHGRRAPDRFVEFGERVYYSVPKKARHKLDLRWRLGICLGASAPSNEFYVGLANGAVVKARSVVRVISSRRWSAEAVEKIIGIPGKMKVDGEQDIGDGIEELIDPHANKDADLIVESAVPEGPNQDGLSLDGQVRITAKDLRTYGYTTGCPRCTDIQAGRLKTNRHHSAECRLRIYLHYGETEHPKWKRYKHLLEPGAAARPAVPDDTAAENEELVADAEDVLPGPFEAAQVHPTAQSEQEVEHDEPNQQAGEFWDWEEHLGDSSVLDGMADDDDDDMPDESAMVDALLLAGADTDVAEAFAKVMMNQISTATFMEVFGRGEICKAANITRRNLNIQGLCAMDLRTVKEDGNPWDFSRAADRRLARQKVLGEKPDWIIGSPPCTVFCQWNAYMNYPKNPDQNVIKKMIKAGRRHLRFMTTLYRLQIQQGRHFLHEHPASALSWKDREMIALARLPETHVVVADQCMYGLTTPGADGGEPMLAKKPTRFMTTSEHMAKRLSTRCNRMHKHQHLVGGRCADAALYPPGLVKAMLLGIRDTADSESLRFDIVKGGQSIVNSVTDSAGKIPMLERPTTASITSTVPFTNGSPCKISYDDQNFRDKYVDEYTGETLPPELIRAAIIDELDYFNSKVWQIEHISEMYKKTDYVRTRSRWVNCNKGDWDSPDVRARLVSCEVNTKKGDKPAEFFASTPPLESQRMMFSRFASERARTIGGKEVPLQMSFVDIRKAYFNGKPKRTVYMDLPREMGLGKEYVARQVRCVDGTGTQAPFGRTATVTPWRPWASSQVQPRHAFSGIRNATSQWLCTETTSMPWESRMTWTGTSQSSRRTLRSRFEGEWELGAIALKSKC